jgi:hypothetical protein
MSENTKSRSVHFDPDLQHHVAELAKAERRSFSAQVQYLVETALSQRSDQHQPAGVRQL